MNSCLTDLYFLPSVAYFKQISSFDKLIIEANDNFVKQTYRNRMHVLGVKWHFANKLTGSKSSIETKIR